MSGPPGLNLGGFATFGMGLQGRRALEGDTFSRYIRKWRDRTAPDRSYVSGILVERETAMDGMFVCREGSLGP